MTTRRPAQEDYRMAAEIRDPVSRVRQRFRTEGESLVVDNWVEPGGALPAHYHPRQEERWSVLEGEVRFRHGDHERVIGPRYGEIVVAAGQVHAVTSSSDREAHLRCYVTPPLRLQQFLEEAAEAAQRGLFSTGGRPRGLRGARWAAGFLKRYRDETVFLAPPAIVQRLLIALLARGS
jgi:quercetin dioxygenase-like cupin family protein